MKRLVIVAVVVLAGASSVLAGGWGSVFGSYGGYGWGGNILGEIAQWQLANRQLGIEERKVDIAENQLGKMNQRNEQQAQGKVYGVAVQDQTREIQQLRSENRELRAENAELKKQLEGVRKELAEMKQMLQKLMESRTPSK